MRAPQPDLTDLVTIEGDEPFILHPGEFVLGQTLEWVELPDDLVARLEGKSLGRLGLLIHSTAGYVDPGWKGNLTLELSNVANLPIALYRGMKIGQISFFQMSSPVERPTDRASSDRDIRASRPRPRRSTTRTSSRRRKVNAKAAPTLTADRDGRLERDLGGGTTIALIQAGWFTTDAGAAFGPVPRIMWQKLVEAELNPDNMLNQALNCLLIETPAGRVLIETGIGERMDEHHRAQRGVTGKPILPRLRDAGFEPESIDAVAVSHLHFDHAGGLLTADGGRALPSRGSWPSRMSGTMRSAQPGAPGELRAG